MPTKHPFLSLIIPCYKQQKIIAKNLISIQENLDKTRYSYELIVVIDGQVDDTFATLKKAKLHHATIYEYKQNRGKSYAIRYGMNKSRGDHIMFLDAGMDIDPDGISMLLEHMKWYDADIIVGSKRHPASQVNYVWQRKVLSLGYYYFVKLLFGVKVKDTQAGIKVFKRQTIEKVLPRLVEKRFAGDLEMLVVSKHLGFNKIYEAPIKLDYNFAEISSAATINSIFGILIDTLGIFYRRYILRYYDSPHQRLVEPKHLRKIIYK